MRKWKLKKDTPTIKAGTIFQEVTSDYDKSRELVRIMPLGGTTSPQWTIDDINNFDEWFEEVNEFGVWRPEGGEEYKLMNDGGYIDEATSLDDNCDEYSISVGNCYPIDTPDELIIKEQKLIPQAMHRLKMAAKKAWFEFNGSEGPDWKDYEQEKLSIIYDYSCCKFKTFEVMAVQDLCQVYFPTEESCQA